MKRGNQLDGSLAFIFDGINFFFFFVYTLRYFLYYVTVKKFLKINSNCVFFSTTKNSGMLSWKCSRRGGNETLTKLC